MESVLSLVSTVPFPPLVATFAVLGMVVLLLLLADVVAARNRAMRRHFDKGEAVSDLLTYSSVIDDGIVLNKNGSLTVAWHYRCEDAANAPTTDREIWSERLNLAFRNLGTQWVVHVDSFRRACPFYTPRELSKFPDRVSRAMDEERRAFFESSDTMYEGSNVLTVTWFPPMRREQKLASVLIDDPDAGADDVAGNADPDVLATFRRELVKLENNLSSVFTLERLKACREETEYGVVVKDRLLEWLHYCLTGLNHSIALPEVPTDIARLIGGQEMVGSLDLRIGDKFVRVVSLNKELPPESYPGMLNALSMLPCECRWSSRFIFLDQHEALARLEKERKKWLQRDRGFSDRVTKTPNPRLNHNAVVMAEDTQAMINEVEGGHFAAGYFTSNIVLMDEDPERLEQSANYVAKMAGELGFPAQVEQLNNLDAFLGTLPGHCVENIRAPIVTTMNFADMIPSTTIWTGAAECPCPLYPPLAPALMHCVTSGQTPFRLNFHVRDLGHTIIFGPTGAGKSVFLAMAAAQFLRYDGMTVYAFDKGNSMYALCKAVDGQHYNIAGDERQVRHADGSVEMVANYAFCPLQYLEDQNDVAWAAQWIETLAALGGLDVKAGHRDAIMKTLKTMQGRKDCSLEDFATQLTDAEVREALGDYRLNGIMGYMLAADKDELRLDARGGMAVFEIEELMGMGDPKYSLPVLLYLFRRIERSLKGQPAVIFLDEAWLMLDHPVFSAKIREWLKVLRKANCAVIMATQSLSDATGSSILDVIRESTATKIFLPNPYARHEETAAVYRRMGLNAQQIRIIAEAVPKRQYYYTSEMGSRLFELALGPLQLAFTAVSDKESVATVKELVAQYGDAGWVEEWLKIKGVNPRLLRHGEAREGGMAV